jgi:serine protease Do
LRFAFCVLRFVLYVLRFALCVLRFAFCALRYLFDAYFRKEYNIYNYGNIKKYMPFYKLPKFEMPKLKAPCWKFSAFPFSRFLRTAIFLIFLSSFFGFFAGIISSTYFLSKISGCLGKSEITNSQLPGESEKNQIYLPQTSQEETIIKVVNEVSPAVVSIIITKNLPVIEKYYYNPFGPLFPEFQIPQYEQKGTKPQEVGGGSGFIISADGMILTNKHVVLDKEADYTVLTNDGKKYPAKVLAIDPVQDVAIIKIEGNNFPVVKLGDSDKLQIGQTVIAIGNALGEFRNTVSVGVISGLERNITAGGGGFVETLEDIIQTDAAINKGNSGGPLLNLRGEVIGINTAIAEEAQNIGFAIPINKAKKDIESVKKSGKIIYPFLGVRYVLIDEEVQKDNNLPVNYGAWIQKGEGGEKAVWPGSAAEKAGLRIGDIILEFNGEKITTQNSLAKIIMKYNPGDKVTLKVLRGDEEKIMEVTLGERTE